MPVWPTPISLRWPTASPKPEMQEALKEGEQAVRRSLALDDSDADAHLTMAAFTFFSGWDVKAAERESARAIETQSALRSGPSRARLHPFGFASGR